MTRWIARPAAVSTGLVPRAQAQRAVLAVALVLAYTAGVGGTLVTAQQRPDRTVRPTLSATPSVKLPPIVRRTLSNGVQVWLVEAHEVPLVQVNLVVAAGSGDDPAGQYGLASLTAAMLDEGAGSRSALQLADELDFLGANLSTTSSFDASGVRLNVPVSRLAQALPIMADVALRPTFPQAELDRVRRERITALLQARDDAAAVAPQAFARVVFGTAHRYGTGAVGTEKTLEAFRADDLRQFHAARYRPRQATFVVVGDVTVTGVLPLLERHFGTWKETGPAPMRTPVPAAPQLTAAQVHIIDMPGAAQSQIRIGWVGVPRVTPDDAAIQVLNTILGGSFTSRLNQNLREEHGYSYGAFSRFDMRSSAGPFFAGAGVQTDKTAEALKEFFVELDRIRQPVGDDELAKARNYLALGFPSELETIGDLSSHLEDLLVYGLPPDYYDTYVARIQAVTTDLVRRAAERYIQPDRFAVVVVGDRQAIEPGIRALGRGPVRVWSVQEVLAP